MGEDRAPEDELVQLLRACAPPQLPPARFDHASVLAASRRAAVRRERALAAGGAAVVALLGGGAAVAALGPRPPAPALAPAAPGLGALPLGVGTCGPADRAVYAALVQVVPGPDGQPPQPVTTHCPPGTTGAGVLLTVDGVAGRLEALVGPGPAPSPVGGTGTATTADRRTVTVVSIPTGGASAGPYAGSLDDLARRVARALG